MYIAKVAYCWLEMMVGGEVRVGSICNVLLNNIRMKEKVDNNKRMIRFLFLKELNLLFNCPYH